MACALDENDEFEEYRSRAYSAGASLKRHRRAGTEPTIRPRGGSRRERGRYASLPVPVASDEQTLSLISRMNDLEVSEDSACYMSSSDDNNTMDTLYAARKTLEDHMEVFTKDTLPVRKQYRSLSCRRSSRRQRDVEAIEFPRHRTASMPSRNMFRRPDPDKLRESYAMRKKGYEDRDEEVYRIRSFTTSSKGVINRGDSFKIRKSVSQVSLDSTGSCTQRDPNFRARSYSSNSQDSATNMSGCSSTDGDIPTYTVLMLGSNGVGKSSLTHQFMTSENVDHNDMSMETDGPATARTVTVQVDGEEFQLVILDISPDDDPWTVVETFKEVDAYVVVYSIADTESFNDAVDALHELRKDSNRDGAVILVANKGDIVRNREVTEDSGKTMAVRYDCKYIEVSAVLNHRVDELLVGVIRQIRLKRKVCARKKKKCIPDENGCVQDAARGLINRLFKHHPYAFGSCDNLLVL